MSTMFLSNLLHWNLPKYPDVSENTTVIMCAHNEEKNIARSIRSVFAQRYAGHIRLIVVDNASDDCTKQEIVKMQGNCVENCSLEYVYCGQPGKAHALNCGLEMVCTPYFITVDGDTCLEKRAVQKIMNHIVSRGSACVAGNLFVQNPGASLAAGMQNYDYLLSIAAIKRFQGSYCSTLVAQGAFSAYRTDDVRQIGGWTDVMGEDIVLTYQLLRNRLSSTYEPAAVVLYLFGMIFYRTNRRIEEVQPDPEKPVIALTFDDGPNACYTPQVLDILYEQQVPATFFLVGEKLQAGELLVREMALSGHEIGSHTYSHRDLTI